MGIEKTIFGQNAFSKSWLHWSILDEKQRPNLRSYKKVFKKRPNVHACELVLWQWHIQDRNVSLKAELKQKHFTQFHRRLLYLLNCRQSFCLLSQLWRGRPAASYQEIKSWANWRLRCESVGSITTEGRHVVSWRELSVEITNSRPAVAKLSTLPPSCGTHKHVSETTHSLGTADSLGTWENKPI